jgi:hypothetical protein
MFYPPPTGRKLEEMLTYTDTTTYSLEAETAATAPVWRSAVAPFELAGVRPLAGRRAR